MRKLSVRLILVEAGKTRAKLEGGHTSMENASCYKCVLVVEHNTPIEAPKGCPVSEVRAALSMAGFDLASFDARGAGFSSSSILRRSASDQLLFSTSKPSPPTPLLNPSTLPQVRLPSSPFRAQKPATRASLTFSFLPAHPISGYEHLQSSPPSSSLFELQPFGQVSFNCSAVASRLPLFCPAV